MISWLEVCFELNLYRYTVLDEWAASPGSGSCDFGLIDKLGAWSLVEGLTQWDPAQRLTLQEALAHPALQVK